MLLEGTNRQRKIEFVYIEDLVPEDHKKIANIHDQKPVMWNFYEHSVLLILFTNKIIAHSYVSGDIS